MIATSHPVRDLARKGHDNPQVQEYISRLLFLSEEVEKGKEEWFICPKKEDFWQYYKDHQQFRNSREDLKIALTDINTFLCNSMAGKYDHSLSRLHPMMKQYYLQDSIYMPEVFWGLVPAIGRSRANRPKQQDSWMIITGVLHREDIACILRRSWKYCLSGKGCRWKRERNCLSMSFGYRRRYP